VDEKGKGMQILDNLIIVALIILAFIAGMRLEFNYHIRSKQDVKDALERQYLRLRAKADADDPCRPYAAPQVFKPINSGDNDGDRLIDDKFMEQLKTTGHAKTTLRKSDLSK
jgi:hypothetical protein